MKKTFFCLIILTLLINFGKIFSQDKHNPAVTSSNRFAINLFNNLGQNQNLFFSPFSISTAIAIAINGARDVTLQSVKNTLKINTDLPSYNIDFKSLLTKLNIDRKKDSIELSLANSLWMQQDFNFNKSFVEIAEGYYNSELNQTNFKLPDELEKSRIKINDWVEEKTKNKIKDLIKPNILDTTTRLIITNAIYFKGRWLYQFDLGQTVKEPFYSDDEKISTDFMKLNETSCKYYEEGEFKMIELPYLGEEFSMIIILPDMKDGIDNLESNFSLENYTEWTKNLKQEIVDVSIPKFKLDSEFKLSQVLSQMGMQIAFSDEADFRGMVDDSNKVDNLKISDIIHKSFMDINEAGTEASAATAAFFVYPVELTPPVENKKFFKADHPFIFLIKENSTNTILFLGRMINPKTG